MTQNLQKYFSKIVDKDTAIFNAKLLTQAANKTQNYYIPLINLIEHKPENGSGVLVIIEVIKGIITNHHVAILFKNNTITTSTKKINNLKLHIKKITSLQNPKKLEQYPDIAFIELTNESIKAIQKTEKLFHNLMNSSERIKTNEKNLKSQPFVINGLVAQKLWINNDANNKTTYRYPYPQTYGVVPDLKSITTNEYIYEKFDAKFDLIQCPIDTNMKLPSKYSGMSGGPLWSIEYIKKNNIVKIIDITLYGIATEQTFTTKTLVCRGPITLYKTFLPFYLQSINKKTNKE